MSKRMSMRLSKRFFVAITLVSMLSNMLSTLSMVCLMSIPAMAVPSLIDYQGKLTNISGCVLNGEYQIKFLLYYEETGGTALWNEQQTVIVDEGLFDVQLGKVTPFPADLFENDSRYLEMVMYNPEMNSWETLSPRQRLTSTAYAMKAVLSEQALEAEQAYHARSSDHALDADTVDGQHASSFLLPSGDYGRSGVASDLYEGTTSLSDKYVNEGQADSVTSPMIADNAVDSSKIANGTIQKEDLSFPLADGYSLDAVDGSPVDAVYVDANGSVGIGTKSPQGALSVSGDAYFSKKLALFGDKIQSDRLISADYSTSDTSSHLYGYRSADYQNWTR